MYANIVSSFVIGLIQGINAVYLAQLFRYKSHLSIWQRTHGTAGRVCVRARERDTCKAHKTLR